MFSFRYSTMKPNAPGPVVEVPSTAGTAYTVGEALAVSSGKAVAADGTVKPQYVCIEAYTAPSSGNRGVLCVPVNPAQVWECPVTAAPTALTVGSKVTMSSGTGVTATTTGGVAAILDKRGATAANDLVFVRFE